MSTKGHFSTNPINSGISKRTTDDTELRTLTGTPRYLAPEVLHYVRDMFPTDSYSYTNAVDIWSIGVITYEMTTREFPFPDQTCLKNYYDKKAEFPAGKLRAIGASEEQIKFISDLLRVKNTERPSAEAAITYPWLQLVSSENTGAVDLNAKKNQDSVEIGENVGDSQVQSSVQTPSSISDETVKHVPPQACLDIPDPIEEKKAGQKAPPANTAEKQSSVLTSVAIMKDNTASSKSALKSGGRAEEVMDILEARQPKSEETAEQVEEVTGPENPKQLQGTKKGLVREGKAKQRENTVDKKEKGAEPIRRQYYSEDEDDWYRSQASAPRAQTYNRTPYHQLDRLEKAAPINAATSHDSGRLGRQGAMRPPTTYVFETPREEFSALNNHSSFENKNHDRPHSRSARGIPLSDFQDPFAGDWQEHQERRQTSASSDEDEWIDRRSRREEPDDIDKLLRMRDSLDEEIDRQTRRGLPRDRIRLRTERSQPLPTSLAPRALISRHHSSEGFVPEPSTERVQGRSEASEGGFRLGQSLTHKAQHRSIDARRQGSETSRSPFIARNPSPDDFREDFGRNRPRDESIEARRPTRSSLQREEDEPLDAITKFNIATDGLKDLLRESSARADRPQSFDEGREGFALRRSSFEGPRNPRVGTFREDFQREQPSFGGYPLTFENIRADAEKRPNTLGNTLPQVPGFGSTTNSLGPQNTDNWFAFFRKCGIDRSRCEQYALSFSNRLMNEKSKEAISPRLLHSYGFNESDVMLVITFLADPAASGVAKEPLGLMGFYGGY